MKKRLISVIICTVLSVSLLAGCGSKTEEANPAAEEANPATEEAAQAEAATGEEAKADADVPAEEAAPAEAYNIGYSNMQLKEDFFITVEAGVKQACAENGYEYNTSIAERDASKMKQNIEALATKGADVIIDFNVLAEAGSAIAKDLKAENIPMISVDCQYDDAYFFGVNNYDAGVALGEGAGAFVDDKFGGELDYIVALWDSQSGDDVKARCGGAVEVLAEKYNVSTENQVWLDSRADDVKTQTMSKDWLDSHPDAKKVIFVGQNDDRGYAINAAVEAADRKADSLVVSHNADPAAVENLQKHAQDGDTAWVCSASYNSFLYGEQIIDMAARILKGEDVAQSEYTKVTIVTAENVEDYIAERDAVMSSFE